MSKELIVSSGRHETRVAILEDDQVVELFHEREKEYSLAGSIHKGRVTRVLPGMQSAFVDIGLERDAFLYVSDFFEDNDEYDAVVSTVEEKVLKMESRGPVPVLMANLLVMARSGALDGALLTTDRFYQTNFTKALLFLSDGSYLANLAQQENLLGSQWGMMNETGNYPGQAWLWLYTFWYQVSPMNTSGNGDILVWAMLIATALSGLQYLWKAFALLNKQD